MYGKFLKNLTNYFSGRCHANFPKPLNEYTIEDKNGYPQYRRRDNGEDLGRGPNYIANTWVIPYNPELTRKYNAHINVEVCSTITAVKYLYKYIYKGHDKLIHGLTTSSNFQINYHLKTK